VREREEVQEVLRCLSRDVLAARVSRTSHIRRPGENSRFRIGPITPPASSEQAEAPTLTQENVILGTAGYMSPEQIRGTPADARSDIFSLGCVLYEMTIAAGPEPMS
jgi:serine/threonine protein kinase